MDVQTYYKDENGAEIKVNAPGRKGSATANNFPEGRPLGSLVVITKDNASDDHIKDIKKLDGGINLNPQAMGMDVAKDGSGVELAFDPAMVARLKRGDFAGVVPVILSITSVKDPLASIGLSPSGL
ncbi:MAG: hypothetical protein WCI27_08385 [Candidatus Omnitrophota bacterium]